MCALIIIFGIENKLLLLYGGRNLDFSWKTSASESRVSALTDFVLEFHLVYHWWWSTVTVQIYLAK